ncbi:leucine-rich repeat-containing protein [Cavenderia fasciculata]|uniref:Leucine-rich repeat-containing protein n=1 Tax=Cavenderia fasciculata TaxID=261658 RepID=F4PGH8_CACFS|nr:leucine-rich repeat-containing protein [Cavenderia fasciculata]EGG24812.1 leucine-rich repeat-containing protein [Cavenderia fasciculata]|eukprot:XP_004362663.1 leucine-rich repeat-containing protein [Cavenderia fasciculata]
MYSINKSKVYDYDIYSYFCDNEEEARERRKRLAFLKQSAANIHLLNKANATLPTATTTTTSTTNSYSNSYDYCSSCDEADKEDEDTEDEEEEEDTEEEEYSDEEEEEDEKDRIIPIPKQNNTTDFGCYTNTTVTVSSSSNSNGCTTATISSSTNNNNNDNDNNNVNNNICNNNVKNKKKKNNNNTNKICSKIKRRQMEGNNNHHGMVKSPKPIYVSSGGSMSSYDEDCLFEDYQDGTIQLDGAADLHRQQQDLHHKLNGSHSNSSIGNGINGNGGINGTNMLSQNSSHNGINIQSQLNRYTSEDFKRKDWNDEFQTLLAHPDTEQKFSKLSHLARDFVAAAKNYATIIINELCLPYKEKSLAPVDVGGIAGGMKWYCQGILFKFAMDTMLSDDCWMYGGDMPRDDYASKAASNELKGLISYYMTGVQGLHYPLIALIDYKGFRIIALSLLPINTDTIRYGSCDSGTIVHYDVPDLNTKMREAGKKINLKPHKVGSDPEFTKVLSSPGDIEAHLGSDNRYYVIDFSRTFPPEALLKRTDVNRRSIFYNLLRPEFVAKWSKPLCSDAFTGWQRLDEEKQEHNKEIEDATEYLLNQAVRELADKLDRDVKGKMLPSAAASNPASNNLSAVTTGGAGGEDPTDFNEIKTQFANKFLPIVMKRLELGNTPPQILQQQQQVAGEINNTQASSTMNDSMDSVATSASMPDTPVRKHVRSLNQVKNETPKMLSTLNEEIHRLGINLRHMGRIRHFSLSLKVRDLLLLEMTARSIKTIIKDEMRSKMKEVQGLSEEPFKQIVILIFNQVLDYQSLIWKRIRERIKSKYSLAFMKLDPRGSGTIIEEQEENWMDSINPRNLFERLQYLTGISLSPIAQHEFTRDPFSFQFVDSDIQEIYANVKHMNIVDYAEGMALSMAAKSKSGREQLRLLKMATSKFQSSLKSNPDNFDCICQLGRTLILQANSINVVSGAFGKNLYLRTLEEAAAKFKDAIQIAPTNCKAYYELAHLYILIAQYYHNVPFQAQKHYKMASIEFDHALRYYDQQQSNYVPPNASTTKHITKRIIVSSEGEGEEERAERERIAKEDLFTTVFADTKKLFDFGKEGMSMSLIGVANICEVLEKHRPRDVGVKLLLGKALVYRPSHHEDSNERRQQEFFVQAYTKFNHALLIDRDAVYEAIFKIGKDMWINSKLGSKRLYYPTALIFRLLVQYHPSPDNKIYSMYSDSLNEMIKFNSANNDDTFIIELSNLYDKLFKMNNQYVLEKLNDSLNNQGQSLVDLLVMATYSKEIKERMKLAMSGIRSIDFHRTSINDQVMGILGEFFDSTGTLASDGSRVDRAVVSGW